MVWVLEGGAVVMALKQWPPELLTAFLKPSRSTGTVSANNGAVAGIKEIDQQVRSLVVLGVATVSKRISCSLYSS